jgi:hypothetical protein
MHAIALYFEFEKIVAQAVKPSRKLPARIVRNYEPTKPKRRAVIEARIIPAHVGTYMSKFIEISHIEHGQTHPLIRENPHNKCGLRKWGGIPAASISSIPDFSLGRKVIRRAMVPSTPSSYSQSMLPWGLKSAIIDESSCFVRVIPLLPIKFHRKDVLGRDW